MKRTHTCGELTDKQLGKKVTLDGWVCTRRDHGGVIFIDLRDRYGLTQVVFDPGHNKGPHKQAHELRREFCIRVFGVVKNRKKGMENTKLKTGKIEVFVDSLEILNKSETPPIEIDDRVDASDEVRLKYRYLDLRRPKMQKQLALRHETAKAAREYMDKNNFLEIETPLLVKSTPEGARDYVVPSRVNAGKFYALPQSPQLYKQILMVSGFDRYYQLARCLRDEDLRSDRQPEHTQIDLEMSFVEQEDVMELVEGLYKHIFKTVLNKNLGKFPIFTHEEAMAKFGTEKPDLRFGLELINVTSIVKKSDFKVFSGADAVNCLYVEKDFSRKEIDSLTDFITKEGAKGLAWIKVGKTLEGTVVKFLSEKIQKELVKKTKAKKGILFFVADEFLKSAELTGKLRVKLGNYLNLIKEGDFKFCWVVDFPLFEWNEDDDRWAPCHHMFTSPKDEHLKYLEKEPGKILGKLYDVVLNGLELGSGSIRIVKKEIQQKVLKVIGINEKQAEDKFGFLMNAFKFGACPHGGMGLGFDRLVALMCGFNDIREVIAFPKNKEAQCPMDGSPSDISSEQMKELYIKSDVPKK